MISTSPELTELLFQLGKGSQVAATPQFSEHPPEAKAIPVLGPLFLPSVELTARLRPDWVLVDALNLNAAYRQGLTALGQRQLTVDLSSVEKLFTESERILETVWHEKATSHLDPYRACWSALAAPRAGTFLGLAWITPPVAIGRATFLSDLLRRVGGSNVLPESLKLPYPGLSEDWIATHPPDTVYSLESGGGAFDFHKWWPRWSGRVVAMSGDHFSRASFTPFHHLGELTADLPKECRALAR